MWKVSYTFSTIFLNNKKINHGYFISLTFYAVYFIIVGFSNVITESKGIIKQHIENLTNVLGNPIFPSLGLSQWLSSSCVNYITFKLHFYQLLGQICINFSPHK